MAAQKPAAAGHTVAGVVVRIEVEVAARIGEGELAGRLRSWYYHSSHRIWHHPDFVYRNYYKT
jgi:hypothetical protein